MRSPVRLLLEAGPGIALIVVANSLAYVAFIRAIDIGEISYVTPIGKIVPVFVLPMEILLLGELLTPLQLAGVALATVAVYVANFQGGAWIEPIRRAAHSRAAQFALLSTALFAIGDVGRRVTPRNWPCHPRCSSSRCSGNGTPARSPRRAQLVG